MKKKILLLLLLILSTIANAGILVDGIQYDYEVKYVGGSQTWEYTATVISRKEKYSGDIIIPSSFKYEFITGKKEDCKVVAIGNRAFYDCKNLTSVTIPSSVTSIGAYAFSGCGLSSYSIPNNITKIEQGTFENCSALVSIEIPSSIKKIGLWAFRNCENLSSISIPNSVEIIERAAFEKCSGLTSITIPNSVTEINDNVFSGCTSLTSIVIGSGISKIGDEAFTSCSQLKELYCYAKAVPTTDKNSFKSTNINNVFLYVPSGSITSYESTTPWKNFKKIVAIGSKPMYKITYMIDGKEYKTIEYEIGASVIPEPAPDGDYKSFEWENLPQTMPDNDITVNAKYTINKYTLTYMLDDEVYKTVEYEYGAEIVTEPKPHSWYDSFEWENLPSSMPKENVTVYAKYTLAKYKLTYMIDGKEYKTVEYEYGATIDEEPAPDGEYSSFKWVGVPSTMPDHDVVVNASHTSPPKSYKMIINLKNGEQITFVLSDKPEVTFAGDRLVVNSTSNTIDCSRSDIVDFHFEEIKTDIASISYNGQDEIKIYNMSGQEVATHKGTLSEAKIMLDSYRPGLYILKVGNKVTIKYLKK